MVTLSLTKEARIYNGKKTASLTSGVGKTGQPLVKEWNWTQLLNWASPVAQRWRLSLLIQEMQVPGWDYPMEEEMATHSSFLTWKIPWTEESGGLQFIGLQRVKQDWKDWAGMQLLHLHQMNRRKLSPFSLPLP